MHVRKPGRECARLWPGRPGHFRRRGRCPRGDRGHPYRALGHEPGPRGRREGHPLDLDVTVASTGHFINSATS